MDEGHFKHSGEILGGLFKPREDASAFFQPSDQSFDDIPLAVQFSVKLNGTSISIFVGFGWDHRLNPDFQEAFINPVGSVSFVAGQSNGPSDRFAFAIGNFRVCTVQQ